MELEHLKEIYSGSKVSPTCSAAKMHGRLESLRKDMADAGLVSRVFGPPDK